MALVKLWQAIFGKRSSAARQIETEAPPAERSAGQSRSQRGKPNHQTDTPAADESPAGSGKKRSSGGQKRDGSRRTRRRGGRATTSPETPMIAIAVDSAPLRSVRVASPKRNGWTKLIGGRRVLSILDTRIGDARRAAEVLEAIVCDSVPVPKYIAIDPFDLGDDRLTVREFHQRIRRVGGQAVAIPGELAPGLRHLSQTLGTVDLLLIDAEHVNLTRLEIRRLLGRVIHPQTLVLCLNARGVWAPPAPGCLVPAGTRPPATELRARAA